MEKDPSENLIPAKTKSLKDKMTKEELVEMLKKEDGKEKIVEKLTNELMKELIVDCVTVPDREKKSSAESKDGQG